MTEWFQTWAGYGFGWFLATFILILMIALPLMLAVAIPSGTAMAYPIQDYYLTNPIARASPTLQRCSAEILHGQDYLEAAE